MSGISEHAWNMIKDLRIELREAQKIRSQIIGVKIAFVATSLGFVVGGKNGPDYSLVLVPAFAAIFFDFLIISYGISIKRIGYYCRTYLEPKIRISVEWPIDEPLWEEAMSDKDMTQNFARTGNIGLTAIVVIPSVFILNIYEPFNKGYDINQIIGFLLLLLLFLDIYFCYLKRYVPTNRLKWPPL